VPTIVRLRNVSGQTLEVAPLAGRVVGADTVVDLAGEVLDEKAAAEQGFNWPDDAYLISAGNPPVVRAWPHAQWRTDKRAPKSPTADTVTTEEQ
jgi:hypothetical protein